MPEDLPLGSYQANPALPGLSHWCSELSLRVWREFELEDESGCSIIAEVWDPMLSAYSLAIEVAIATSFQSCVYMHNSPFVPTVSSSYDSLFPSCFHTWDTKLIPGCRGLLNPAIESSSV